MHGAGAARRHAAAEFRPDDVEILAQDPEQRLLGLDIDLARLAVDGERDHRSMKRITQDEHVHLGAQEAVERLLGLAHDRLVLVEGGVEHHRHAGDVAEGLDQARIARVAGPGHGLQAAASRRRG